MEQKPLKDFIIECAEAKSLNIEKIYSLTGIPRHYLNAIFAGEWHKLPAAPYARGYLKKLDSALGLSNDHLWQLYKEEAKLAASGPEDRLPINRFAIKAANKKWVWLALLVILFGAYGILNFDRFLGIPEIIVLDPLETNVISHFANYALIGKINPKDKFYINGEEVYVDQDGNFHEPYSLQPGTNNFELVAKRFLGKETKVQKQIIYQPTQ